MINYFEKKEKMQQEQQKYFREKTNLRLKYAALVSAGITIVPMLLIIFGVVDLNNIRLVLLLRGCTGLFAIVFVILVSILVYRVNNSYVRARFKRNHK